jgi:hypothetical protein
VHHVCYVLTGGIKSAHDVLTDDRLSREKAYADDIATQHQVPAAVTSDDATKDSSTSSKTAVSKRSRHAKVLFITTNTAATLNCQPFAPSQ